MKRIVPLHVRMISAVVAAGITTLLIWVHGADLTTLGAPDTAATSTAVVATASVSGGAAG